MRRATTAAALLLAFVLPASIRADDDRDGPTGLPPMEQTMEEEAARNPDESGEEAMAARMAETRAQFTAEEIQALADSPERQPDHVEYARTDDPRLIRSTLIEAHRAERARREAERRAEGPSLRPGASAGMPARPPVSERSDLEETENLRREIDRQTGNAHTVPPAPTEPPAGAVVVNP